MQTIEAELLTIGQLTALIRAVSPGATKYRASRMIDELEIQPRAYIGGRVPLYSREDLPRIIEAARAARIGELRKQSASIAAAPGAAIARRRKLIEHEIRTLEST